ncbi:mitochondrial ribosomal protein L37-domain-containing protein [Cokeromyces recurvatus]|uniref:mitochondrial ribosomal protein L37-domain-containing protein n=1 Tax=Cokeromyces recurvatus TaxID=90255 RepID=UPI002220A62A|nr:mitochondrial ribosomal protein L37-domain-containing protein [Cokeromyces recurvatus]KAI7901547.1 mitochondrial ribosomal protein L37-domain-containing protein [Cokeromyces recurvatus]
MLSNIIRNSRPLFLQKIQHASYIHSASIIKNATDSTLDTTTTQTRAPSSVPKGTVLKGIQYLKDKPDLMALDDSEYPDWLWDLLDEKKQKQKTAKPTNRQYHRKQNRDAIKAMNFMKDKKN